MMTRTPESRRKFIEKCFNAGTIVVGMLSGCGKNDHKEERMESKVTANACDDLANVSESDVALRQKLGYAAESPIPENQCQNCNLYLPPKEDQKCGGCMLFKGPVFPSAYCTYWAPKV